MDRVEVSRSFVGLTGMQVCAVKDATDKEILAVCNAYNPAGTTKGWTTVIREENAERHNADGPVQCNDHADRNHYLVLC